MFFAALEAIGEVRVQPRRALNTYRSLEHTVGTQKWRMIAIEYPVETGSLLVRAGCHRVYNTGILRCPELFAVVFEEAMTTQCQ